VHTIVHTAFTTKHVGQDCTECVIVLDIDVRYAQSQKSIALKVRLQVKFIILHELVGISNSSVSNTWLVSRKCDRRGKPHPGFPCLLQYARIQKCHLSKYNRKDDNSKNYGQYQQETAHFVPRVPLISARRRELNVRPSGIIPHIFHIISNDV
jgi:hypothetical protein